MQIVKRIYTTSDAKGKPIEHLCLRVIQFRDLLNEGESLADSGWLTLPEAFTRVVNSMACGGPRGGHASSVHALIHSFHLDWHPLTPADKGRRIVFLFTCSPVQPLAVGETAIDDAIHRLSGGMTAAESAFRCLLVGPARCEFFEQLGRYPGCFYQAVEPGDDFAACLNDPDSLLDHLILT